MTDAEWLAHFNAQPPEGQKRLRALLKRKRGRPSGAFRLWRMTDALQDYRRRLTTTRPGVAFREVLATYSDVPRSSLVKALAGRDHDVNTELAKRESEKIAIISDSSCR